MCVKLPQKAKEPSTQSGGSRAEKSRYSRLKEPSDRAVFPPPKSHQHESHLGTQSYTIHRTVFQEQQQAKPGSSQKLSDKCLCSPAEGGEMNWSHESLQFC